MNEHLRATSVKIDRSPNVGSSQRRFLLALGLMLAPGVSWAMGDVGLIESALVALAMFFLWLIASGTTVFWKSSRFSSSWCLSWAIRLSLPVAAVWFVFLEPELYQARREQIEISAKKSFERACAAQVKVPENINANKVATMPGTIYVDEFVGSAGLNVAGAIGGCVSRKSNACEGVNIAVVEWVSRVPDGPVCKPDKEGGEAPECVVHYLRWDLADPKAGPVRIDRPTAEYAIRVRQKQEPDFDRDRIEKFHVTLETVGTRKVLASTDLLYSYYSPPCQDYAKEISKLLTYTFSK